MTWQIWSAFVLIETALCLTPGPAVLLVLSQALTRGAARAVWSILGILAANTVYFVLSATGIGAILMASYDLFFAIKWIGAAYLVWLGVGAFLGHSKALAIRAGSATPVSGARLFLNGFVLQMSNPKALVFFSALLPQFINPHAALWPQVAILAVTSIVIEFLVQAIYATLAGRAAHLAAEPRFARITDRVAGTLLIGAGIGMAALRKT
ncbi:MAG TPA: LysE family translocator [Rhizomicrobium sp.]|jgi:threonine/homoserine/homoserine lactone efflux protein|nr:LysE family translocator [Rhizomicrobium sp.]